MATLGFITEMAVWSVEYSYAVHQNTRFPPRPPAPNLTHWGEKEHLPNPYGKLKNNTAVPPGEIEELMTHMEEKKEKGVKLAPFAAAFQWNIFSS